MKKTVLLVVVTFSLWSCGASQPARVYGNKNISNNNSYSYNTNNEKPSKSKNKKSSNHDLSFLFNKFFWDYKELIFTLLYVIKY